MASSYMMKKVISQLVIFSFWQHNEFSPSPNSNHVLISFTQTTSIWINKAMFISDSTEICAEQFCLKCAKSPALLSLHLEYMYTQVNGVFLRFFVFLFPPWGLYQCTWNLHNLRVFFWDIYFIKLVIKFCASFRFI